MAYLRIAFSKIEGQLDAKLLETANIIHQQVGSRTAVFPLPIPTMLVLKDACDEFQSAVNAAAGGDLILKAQRNIYRLDLLAKLQQLSYYVMHTANGDRQIAMQGGFPFAKEPESQTIVVPTDLLVTPGIQSGEMLMSVKRVAGAAAYLHQYSTDPLHDEANWMSMNCTSRKCKITGLIPGTVYYFRVGVIGSKDQVLYSAVTSKMAV
jgi:hypothetical protein